MRYLLFSNYLHMADVLLLSNILCVCIATEQMKTENIWYCYLNQTNKTTLETTPN
jgi:hypothetical protein